jgi:hypothetical protein
MVMARQATIIAGDGILSRIFLTIDSLSLTSDRCGGQDGEATASFE